MYTHPLILIKLAEVIKTSFSPRIAVITIKDTRDTRCKSNCAIDHRRTQYLKQCRYLRIPELQSLIVGNVSHRNRADGRRKITKIRSSVRRGVGATIHFGIVKSEPQYASHRKRVEGTHVTPPRRIVSHVYTVPSVPGVSCTRCTFTHT